jgi:hypothetical protein
MPKLGSNRIKKQTRREKNNNLMQGLGRRNEMRELAEENTRQKKIERFQQRNLS